MSLKIALLLGAMFVIAGIVRLLKSDGALPWTVPPKWRPLLAMLLGLIGTSVAAAVKAAWPAMPVDWTTIAEVGVAGPAFSSLLNGLAETAKAPAGVPVITKSVRPTVEPSAELVDVPKPPPLPPGTGTPLVFLLIAIGAVATLTPYALCGCNGGTQPASSPARETARATVLLVADGVRAADVACAEVVKAGHPEVGKKCVDAYAIARPAVVAAGEAVDSWDAASSAKVGCAVVHALDALRSMQSSIEGGGGRLPPAVTDAITFATGLGAIACPAGGAS